MKDELKRETLNKANYGCYGFPVDWDRGERHLNKSGAVTSTRYLRKVGRLKLKNKIKTIDETFIEGL